MLVYPRVQCAGRASASDRAVRLALPAQCVVKRGPGRKAVRKAVWPPKPTANQEASRLGLAPHRASWQKKQKKNVLAG